MITGFLALQTSEVRADKKTMLPRSPGYSPSEHSAAKLEFQDSKLTIYELKEVARTTAPDKWQPDQPLPRIDLVIEQVPLPNHSAQGKTVVNIRHLVVIHGISIWS